MERAAGGGPAPLLVPATSIYSRTDGVAPWQTCIDDVREHAENIEVLGSHVGMAVNPAVILAVLDRLAQPEGDWRPFAPPPAMRGWYPRPGHWRDRQQLGRRVGRGQRLHSVPVAAGT